MPFLDLVLAPLLIASPPNNATQDDLQCIAVAAAAVGMQGDKIDPTVAAGLVGGMMYFLGRIEGREPAYDFDRNFNALLSRPDIDKILAANAARCGAIMEERGDRLVNLGQGVQSKAK